MAGWGGQHNSVKYYWYGMECTVLANAAVKLSPPMTRTIDLVLLQNTWWVRVSVCGGFRALCLCVLQVPQGTAMCTIRLYAYGLSDDLKTAVFSIFRSG